MDERLLEQLLPGREVVMNERRRGPRPSRDPGNSDLVDARGGDQVACRLEDPLGRALGPGCGVGRHGRPKYHAAASATPASARTAAAALRPLTAITLPAG